MPRKHVPTLSEWFEQWIAARSLRPSSQANYRSQFRLYLHDELGNRRLNTITNMDVQRVLREVERRTKPRRHVLSPGKVNAQRVYALVRVLLNDAEEAQLIERNSVKLRGMGADASARRPTFALDDYKRVREHLSSPFRLAADLALGAALRHGEVLGLEWRDWNPATGLLWVERQSDGVRTWETKTSDAAHVPVLLIGRQALEVSRPPWATPDQPIVQVPAARRGHRMQSGALDRAWNQARQRAGLPTFRFHDLRHLACTLYARTGALPVEVMQFARHRDVGSALRYQHLGDEERQRELRAKADERLAATFAPVVTS